MKKCPVCGSEYVDTTTLCPNDGAVLKRDSDPLVGATLAGKYRIEEQISEGGMGVVYRATHILMDKTVAIKVLHPALAADDTVVARFTREAKAASRISHPHAINVTDFGESESGVVFLVMEFLRGQTLKEAIREAHQFELGRTSEIIRQVSGALDAAHAEGVVHRDLKSDNIMLVDAVADADWAKVLDFGIAKIQESVGGSDPALTAPNLIIGTPQYMSPEQCSQSPDIDHRSDIYSLGIITYEMLVGHVPFTGESPTAIMLKQIQEAAPSVLEERSDLTQAVADTVAHALAKSPANRFASAGQFAEALAAATQADATANESTPIAAAVASGAATVTGAQQSLASDTDRQTPAVNTDQIVSPTANDEYDDETIISSRDTSAVEAQDLDETPSGAEQMSGSGAFIGEYSAALPPQNESSNRAGDWLKIAIPVVILLAVIGGVMYALRDGASNENQNTPPLTADPNSRPVQSVGTVPTGESERNIQTRTNANANQSGGSTTGNSGSGTSNPQGNQDTLPPPSTTGNMNNPGITPPDFMAGNANSENSNEPTNRNGNTNSRRPTPTPQPSATTTPNDNANNEPPPAPTPKRTQTPQPTPKPPAPSDSAPPPINEAAPR